MSIIITDEDAERLLSIPEAIEAMRVAFRDLSDGRAVNPPRLRYSAGTPDPARRYTANIHAGAVESAGVACVRAGSAFTPVQQADGRKVTVADDVNYTSSSSTTCAPASRSPSCMRPISPGCASAPPAALAVSLAAREDAEVLGLFGTGMQAMPNCRAICAVRPIKRVQGVQPEPCAPRRVREADGGRDIRDHRGR